MNPKLEKRRNVKRPQWFIRLRIYSRGMGWHTFRRTSLTMRQTVGGATPLEAMKAAGHTKVDMTLVYSLLDANREKEQVGRMYDYIMGEGTGVKQ
jgi:integrase